MALKLTAAEHDGLFRLELSAAKGLINLPLMFRELKNDVLVTMVENRHRRPVEHRAVTHQATRSLEWASTWILIHDFKYVYSSTRPKICADEYQSLQLARLC